MKFGRNLHRNVVPSWANSYINYDHLKHLLATDVAFADFCDAFRSEISQAHSFCLHKKTQLQLRLDAVSKRYSIKLGLSDAHVLDCVTKAELEDFQSSLAEIAEQLVQLELYWRVNDEAINLVIDKADALHGDEPVRSAGFAPSSPDANSPCRSRLALVNTTLEAIRHAMIDRQAPRHRSLILERFVKPGSRADYADMLQSVHADDEAALYPLLEDATATGMPLLRAFMQISIVHRSFKCQQLLLPFLAANIHTPVSERHDYLHRIIRRLGHTQSEKASLEFRDMMDALAPHQLPFIESLDSRGRLPLHYAAELGLDGVCREIFAHAKTWKRMVLKTHDKAGETPLELAVREGCTDVVAILLQHIDPLIIETKFGESALLSTAIFSGHQDIAKILVTRRLGVRHIMRDGRTVMHLAVQQNFTGVVEALCNTELHLNTKGSRGRTPLAFAAIQNHHEIAQLLVDRGADLSVLDAYGWSAKDHAAFRGYTKLSAFLGPAKDTPLIAKSSKRRGTRNVLSDDVARDQSHIFVTPGTTDLFKDTPFVNLKPFHDKLAPMRIPESSLWLTVSGIGCNGEVFKIRLPELEDRSDWPWIFKSDDPEDAKLVFKLYSQFRKTPIGTAVALLSSLKEGLGPNRESLMRDFTLPFIDTDGDYIGQVTFTFLVSTPCEGNLPVAYDQELRTPAYTEVGGHRGNGWNDGRHENLQIGENTIQSFQTAADLGASSVEFDVQLTKDHIPIVYHDFLVAEAGIEAAMHYLTYDQFMSLAEAQSCLEQPHHLSKRLPWDDRERPRAPNRRRSRSVCAPDDRSTDALLTRMLRTYRYPGWKANSRNENIYEPFVTLKELYQQLSEDIDLSIEIKYPMLSEARDFLLDSFAPELNMVVDIVLDITATYAGPKRRITLSSFSPEICVAVAAKQKTYPVLFLNDSCNVPTGDYRATSVQTAARLAHRYGMDGVGMAAEPFVDAPGLVPYVKQQGLYTMSYGILNDTVEHAVTQAKLGIDLLFVNKVKLIKQTLDGLHEAGELPPGKGRSLPERPAQTTGA